MGGAAFSPEGLHTPRMPPEVYTSVLSRIEGLLHPHFVHVGHPLEAPAKTSHGDIDLLVAEPKPTDGAQDQRAIATTGEFLAQVLEAERWKRTNGNATLHFAVRWPEEEFEGVGDGVRRCGNGNGNGNTGVSISEGEDREGEADGNGEDARAKIEKGEKTRKCFELATSTATSPSTTITSVTPPNSTQKYIQVDIHVCPTPAYFTWHLFFQAHGDLWNILGSIIRRHGLTCTDQGLVCRIAEVEAHNKEQARIVMTRDPDTVLAYLGLDVQRYWAGFGTWAEMMGYAARCRFHDPGRWRERHENGKQELKANDRQRASKRPVFGYWIQSYLPAHVDDEPCRDAHLSREEVVEDAKRYFGKEFAERFDARKRKWVRQINVDKLWSDMRKSLPLEGGEIGYAMKGMKREVVGESEGMPPGMAGEVEGVRKAYQEGRFEDVLAWAKENCKAVGERQRRLDQEKSRVHLMAKISRDQEDAVEK